MSQLNFADFFGSEHHRNRPKVGKDENQDRMTPFCTRNIPMMFGVQFLSFRISTTEKYFDWIFDDFSGAEKHRSRKGWKSDSDDLVFHPKNTHTIWGAILFVFC